MALRRLLLASALLALALLSALTIPSVRPGPAEASNVTQIAAGQLHTCALLGSGTVKCWGDNTNGKLGDGTTSQRNTPVDVCATGSGAGCSGGSILTGIAMIAAGFGHTCAVTTGGTVKCWGDNALGMLGDGTTFERHHPVDVCLTGSGDTCADGSALTGVLRVSAGGYHTCALMSGGGVKCWGSNLYGQLGNGDSPTGRSNPVDVCATGGPVCTTTLSGALLVSAGAVHTCALMSGGGVKCWGYNFYGQLGNGDSPTDTSNPVDVCAVALGSCPSLLSGASFVEAGVYHTCAVLSGGAVCWGYNGYGQLGDGNAGVDSDVPVNVCANSTCSASLSGVIFVAAGGNHSCATITSNRVKCWGYNFQGQLSNGDRPNNSDTPVDACASPCTSAATDVASAGGDLGSAHGCAPTLSGNVRCAGDNSFGELGDGQACGSPYCDAAVNVTGLSSKTPATTITSPDTAGTVGLYPSMALDASGYPVIAYYDATNGDLKVLHCGDAACSAGNTITPPDTTGNVGATPSIAIDGSGRPVISYQDQTNGDLKVLHCGNANCTAGNSIVSPDTTDAVVYTSISIDSSGNPVIAYGRNTGGSGELRVFHCSDANCTAGSTAILDSVVSLSSGLSPAGLRLAGGAGNPVVAYYADADLRVLKCGNTVCSDGNNIASPDTAGDVGKDAALELDGAGNPVVSYWDGTNAALKVLHCGNATCTAGNVITRPYVAGGGGDGGTSLALDASGKPVVAFWADNGQTVGILRILHCGDANCASGSTLGEPDTGSGGNVGFYPSMRLDAAGNPVVAYYDSTNGDLKLLHCGNPNCGGTLTVPTSNITGTGVAGDSPSGTAAALAQVNDPTGLSQSSSALYFADTNNCEVKKIESGFSYTLAGTGTANCTYSGEGTATSAKLNKPRDVFLKGSDLYIADSENCRIRKITGVTISTVAGTGTCGFLDGTVASAQLNKPKGVAVDGSGNIYIADTENCRIRKVTGGTISTIAGTGACSFAGDGGPATAALLNKPTDVAFLLPGDDLVIADTGNNRIRRYSMSTGMITTIAGTGSAGFSGDGGQATSAKLNGPEALTAIDNRVLIADTQNNRIRRVNILSGVIDTIVGVGGQTGSYALSLPQGVAVVAGGGGGGAGAAAGQGEAAGPDVATAGTTFANSGANLIGVASGSPANDNRGNFRPTTSCSVTPHVSSIDFAILPVMLGLIGFRRRLRVLSITLRSMLTPKLPSSAPAA